MKKLVDYFSKFCDNSKTFTVDVNLDRIIFQRSWTTLLYKSLYLSEGWYELWNQNKNTSYGLYCKTTAMVLFDRCLNNEYERIDRRRTK